VFGNSSAAKAARVDPVPRDRVSLEERVGDLASTEQLIDPGQVAENPVLLQARRLLMDGGEDRGPSTGYVISPCRIDSF